MKLIQRTRQREILECLSDCYPDWQTNTQIINKLKADYAEMSANLSYLEEHGLVTCRWLETRGEPPTAYKAKITARGIDFLADDGGLQAVLGVVTVKLHEQTIRDLLVDAVQSAEADATVKGKLIDQLKSLPAQAVHTLAEQALEAGLRHIPNAARWLQTALSG